MLKRLHDIAEVIMGYSPPGDTCNDSGRGLPLLNGPTEFGPYHPTPVQFTTEPRRFAEPGDLLFCVRGSTTGRMNWADRRYAIGRGIAAIRHRSGVSFQPYVRAAVENALPQLLGLATGSTFPSVSREDIAGIAVPDLNELDQQAIADVLRSLDDKIEQNRRTARVLEELARATFKAWFADFEPVKAKAAGASSFPGMPPAAFAAMPNRLTESPIGPVPNGWEIVDVYKLATVAYGAPFASKRFNEFGDGKPLIRIRDLQTHSPTVATTEEHPRATLIRPGDIVVGMDGEFRLHYWTGPEAWLNQRLCSFRPFPSVPAMYLGEALRAPLDYVERSEAATTVIHLGKYDIDRFELLKPDNVALAAFGDMTSPMLNVIVQSATESSKLIGMRDYLMPRLMTGRARISEIERSTRKAL